jgi:hypothetical protein
MRDPLLKEAIKVTPSRVSMKSSGEPRARTSGWITGIEAARAKAPMTAPISELNKAAPNALPASPFLAMGWPSTIVAAAVPSPGTPKRMEVMSPVVETTECIPRRKAKPSMASMP